MQDVTLCGGVLTGARGAQALMGKRFNECRQQADTVKCMKLGTLPIAAIRPFLLAS